MARPGLTDKIQAEVTRLREQATTLEKALDVIALFESAAGKATAAAATNGNGHAEAADKPTKRHRRKMTPAERKALSKRMKKYWASRRASGTEARV